MTPVPGDPAVDVQLIKEMNETVAKVEKLAVALLDIKNLDESSTRNARRLLQNLKSAVNTVDFQIVEHSRVLLRQAIGGK